MNWWSQDLYLPPAYADVAEGIVPAQKFAVMPPFMRPLVRLLAVQFHTSNLVKICIFATALNASSIRLSIDTLMFEFSLKLIIRAFNVSPERFNSARKGVLL